MIRHSIVSDAYNISHLKQLADDMGHSVGTANTWACMRKRNELRTSFRFVAKMRTFLGVSSLALGGLIAEFQ